MDKFILQDWGEDVQIVIDKVQALVEQGGEDATLLTAADKRKLDYLGIYYNTTAYWQLHGDFTPGAGELVIYSDYDSMEIEGKTLLIPAMKIGTGNGYLADLAFIGGAGGDVEEIMRLLRAHVNDRIVHITEAERRFWNNKLNVSDTHEVEGETLLLNRL